MKAYRVLISSTVLLCLLFVGLAQAVTGPEVAQLLNTRYRLTYSACVGETPVYYCSGVLARRSQNAPTEGFWKLSSEAISTGAERFDYWRIDRAPVVADRTNGFVFTDAFTAIGLGKQLEALPATSDSEMLVKNWNDTAPAQVPLQALFYDLNAAGALREAQRDQRAYFQATGEWLPILRLRLDDAQQNPFGFNQSDQLYIGYQVAARLNARYADTSPTCQDGRAAFYCNGVIVRTTDQSTAFHSWNPSPGSVQGNGVSFSYLRADARVVKLYKPQGFIAREEAAPSGNPMRLRCAFPFDGYSSGAADICRPRSALCSELGITTAEAWAAHYAANVHASCAFDIDPQQFQLSITLRSNHVDPHGWNELVIVPWPEDNPSQLPLEAFMHTTQSYDPGDGLAGAQYDQKDFFDVTGRYVPIVRVTLDAAAGQVFVYDPLEQGVD